MMAGIAWLNGYTAENHLPMNMLRWTAVIAWYFFCVAGVSFVIINLHGRHERAYKLGGVLVTAAAVILAVPLTRWINS